MYFNCENLFLEVHFFHSCCKVCKVFSYEILQSYKILVRKEEKSGAFCPGGDGLYGGRMISAPTVGGLP